MFLYGVLPTGGLIFAVNPPDAEVSNDRLGGRELHAEGRLTYRRVLAEALGMFRRHYWRVALVALLLPAFYGMGSTQMGKYDFASWSMHMAFIIVTSNVIGLLTGEWKGSGRKTIRVVLTGIVVLILSTVIIGCGAQLVE